jgi:flagellar hook-associated protein 2
LTVSSSIVDTSNALGYTSTITGADAKLTVDGVNLTSSSNSVTNLIPGITFQLLGTSATQSSGELEQVQVVIANDNSGVESTVNQFVSDYNSLISAINTQEGNDSSGNAEPLYGSPTLSLLQQQLLGSINTTNPNGSLASISTSTNTTLTGSIKITVGSGTTENIVFGAAPSGGAAANTFYTGSGVNSLADLASTINAAGIGVTANVVTKNNLSSLTLTSQTAGSSGSLAVTSSIVATSDKALSASVTSGSDAVSSTNTSAVTSTATLTTVKNASDILSGSITIEAGSGTTMEFDISSLSDKSLTGLSSAINNAGIGVKASIVSTSSGSQLLLTSETSGSDGTLVVKSSLLDATDTSTATLSYTNSSDINNLSSLGISTNNDGSLTYDAASLDSVLNSDFSSVTGFFQNDNSWGQNFSTMLTNSGSSSTHGVLKLASSSNSSIESTLNADISREESIISAQQKSLTTELNSANQIMQNIPNLLDQVNELYSAITGYNQSK